MSKSEFRYFPAGDMDKRPTAHSPPEWNLTSFVEMRHHAFLILFRPFQ